MGACCSSSSPHSDADRESSSDDTSQRTGKSGAAGGSSRRRRKGRRRSAGGGAHHRDRSTSSGSPGSSGEGEMGSDGDNDANEISRKSDSSRRGSKARRKPKEAAGASNPLAAESGRRRRSAVAEDPADGSGSAQRRGNKASDDHRDDAFSVENRRKKNAGANGNTGKAHIAATDDSIGGINKPKSRRSSLAIQGKETRRGSRVAFSTAGDNSGHDPPPAEPTLTAVARAGLGASPAAKRSQPVEQDPMPRLTSLGGPGGLASPVSAGTQSIGATFARSVGGDTASLDPALQDDMSDDSHRRRLSVVDENGEVTRRFSMRGLPGTQSSIMQSSGSLLPIQNSAATPLSNGTQSAQTHSAASESITNISVARHGSVGSLGSGGSAASGEADGLRRFSVHSRDTSSGSGGSGSGGGGVAKGPSATAPSARRQSDAAAGLPPVSSGTFLASPKSSGSRRHSVTEAAAHLPPANAQRRPLSQVEIDQLVSQLPFSPEKFECASVTLIIARATEDVVREWRCLYFADPYTARIRFRNLDTWLDEVGTVPPPVITMVSQLLEAEAGKLTAKRLQLNQRQLLQMQHRIKSLPIPSGGGGGSSRPLSAQPSYPGAVGSPYSGGGGAMNFSSPHYGASGSENNSTNASFDEDALRRLSRVSQLSTNRVPARDMEEDEGNANIDFFSELENEERRDSMIESDSSSFGDNVSEGS